MRIKIFLGRTNFNYTDMRTLSLLLVALMACLTGMAQDRGFVHPGGMHSKSDFDRVKAQIANKNPIVLKAFNALEAWGKSNTDTGPGATEEIVRGSSNNTGNAAYRVKLAYKYALLWNITGEKKYADIAINILNTWARTCKRVTGDTNAALASGLQGYQFAQVGEPMRGYSGWKAEDFKAFQKWMLDVFYTGNTYFLYIRNGVNPGGYWSNWGLCNALSLMSIGILCDDIYIYNMGAGFIKYDMVPDNPQCKIYRHDEWWDYSGEPYSAYPVIQETQSGEFRDNGYNEYIGNLVMMLHEDERGVDIKGDGKLWLGQMQELGRDQGHNTMSVGEIADICATAWNQGDDIWGWMDNRIAAGVECTALYNYDKECTVPYKKYHYRLDNKSNNYSDYSISSAAGGSRGQYRPVWYKIVSHYEGVKGVKLNYSRLMAESNQSAMDEFSGVDHLGFTHLMDIVPARTDGKRTVYLEPYVTVNSVTKHKSCYDNLGVEQEITLSVVVPDSVKGGTWTWNTGNDTDAEDSQSSSLTVKPRKSNIYRVTYSAPNGTTSTQMFSIGVHGDCYADVIRKHFYVSHPVNKDYDGWKSDDVITVCQGSNSTLSCQAGTNTGTWRYYVIDGGEEKRLDGRITVERDTTVYIEYTNMGGGVSLDSVKFVLAKEQIMPYYKVGDDEAVLGTDVTCSTGSNIVLMPSHSEAASWEWSTGDTTRELYLNNVSTSGEYTVTMTDGEGEQQSVTYTIRIYDLKLVNSGDTIEHAGKKYVLGDNVIGNWTFDDGLAGWYDGTTNTVLSQKSWQVNAEGGVDGNWLQCKTHGGKASADALGTAWEIKDSLYYFGFCSTLLGNVRDATQWQKVSVTNEVGAETEILLGGGGKYGSIYAESADNLWHLNDFVFDNTTAGYKYLQCCFRWEENGIFGFDHFVLCPMSEVDGSSSGIENVTKSDADIQIYDLYGRKVAPSRFTPGVFIVNKKKVVIRF